MRLAARRRPTWLFSEFSSLGQVGTVRLAAGLVEVVRLGEGPPLVIVPGMAGGWRLIAPLARRLASHYQVVVTGLRGDVQSLSSRRADHITDYAADLVEVIDRLELDHPLLMGVSFGGAVALQFAVEWSERIRGLIVQGADSKFQVNLGSWIARRTLERFPLPRDNAFLNQFFNILYGCKPEPGPVLDFLVDRCWSTDQREVAHRLRILDTFDVSDRLWRIDVPTKVIAGSRDVVVPYKRQVKLAEALPCGSLVTIEGAGHIAFLTHAQEVLRQINHAVVPSPRVVI